MTYGQGVMGVPDSVLLAQRRIAASAVASSTTGKNLDLLLATSDATGGNTSADPAFAAHTMVIGLWAGSIWAAWFPRAEVQATVAKAQAELAAAERPWARVRGPAAALIATTARLQWQVIDANTLIDDEGQSYDLSVDCTARGQTVCRKMGVTAHRVGNPRT